MADGKFIGYYRVSSERQGRSGLGLGSQRTSVHNFLDGGDWELIAEFTEIETGTNKRKRPELNKALEAARLFGAAVIVAKVDRLTRSVGFLNTILDSGVPVRFCDLPRIDGPAGRFMLNQMAAVAELEAGMISVRTKEALTAAKARGVKLGRPENATPSGRRRGSRRGVSTLRENADAYATRLRPVLEEIDATSHRGIARELNERGIPTPRGVDGGWSATQVKRVLERVSLV